MKINSIFFVIFFAFSFSVLSQSDIKEQNINAIKSVLNNQAIAWNKGDIKEYMQGYWKNDSLKFIGKKGISYGWETTLKNYEKGYPDKATMGTLNFELLAIDIHSPEIAYVVGNWKLKREKGDIGGIFTLLMKKINGEWKIVVDHTE